MQDDVEQPETEAAEAENANAQADGADSAETQAAEADGADVDGAEGADGQAAEAPDFQALCEADAEGCVEIAAAACPEDAQDCAEAVAACETGDADCLDAAVSEFLPAADATPEGPDLAALCAEDEAECLQTAAQACPAEADACLEALEACEPGDGACLQETLDGFAPAAPAVELPDLPPVCEEDAEACLETAQAACPEDAEGCAQALEACEPGDAQCLTEVLQGFIPVEPETAEEALEAAPSTLEIIWQFFELGGPIIMILGVLSLISLAIILGKVTQFLLQNISAKRFIVRASEDVRAGRGEEALRMLERKRGPVARVMEAAVRGRLLDAPEDKTREEVDRIAQSQLEGLEAGLPYLSLIATISPLLGLLGTVLGMIDAFQQLAGAGDRVDPAILSGGIWEALLTTAAGLAVAIPAAAFFTWLQRTVDVVAARMEDAATRVFTLDLFQARPAAAGHQEDDS